MPHLVLGGVGDGGVGQVAKDVVVLLARFL